MKKLSLIILGILIAAQFAVPFSMIQSRENILSNGDLFRLKTRPIDPADPFQGRYVRLSFENNYIPYSEEDHPDIDYKARIYATIKLGEDGFAHFTGWHHDKPTTGHFLKIRALGRRTEWNSETKKSIYKGLQLDIPFDRYYMDEAKAPRAEQLVRDSTRSTNCWVNVRILNGKAVIEDVFAEGQSLRILAEEEK